MYHVSCNMVMWRADTWVYKRSVEMTLALPTGAALTSSLVHIPVLGIFSQHTAINPYRHLTTSNDTGPSGYSSSIVILCRAHPSPTAPFPPTLSAHTVSPPSPLTLNMMSTCMRIALTPIRPPPAVLTAITDSHRLAYDNLSLTVHLMISIE